MDPISAAIIAAVTEGITKGASAVGGKALVDAYEGLKTLIKTKFGEGSRVARAVEDVEAVPESTGYQQVLKDMVAHTKADQDPEVLKAAQALLEQLKTIPGGVQYIQQATGTGIAQASGGSNATVYGVNTGTGTGMGAGTSPTSTTTPPIPPTQSTPKESEG